MQPTAGADAPRAGPRLSWPTRLIVVFLVFDIVFHSFSSIGGYRDWMEEKDLPRFPKRLPTLREIQEPDEEFPPGDRAGRALDSTWDYLRPWPDQETRGKLKGWRDYGMFEVCWVSSRLECLENLVGVRQR